MRKLFVVGDSYCYYRTDPEQHWPAKLAQNLNLELHGEGFPGEGWWPTRKNILEYSRTRHFSETDLFVICHTDPIRIISGNPDLLNVDLDTVKEIYFKYIQSDDVSSWAVTNWYQELNKLLVDKSVIHLKCFDHQEFNLLKGTKLQTPLLDISIISAGGTINGSDWGGPNVLTNMNEYANHFSPETNRNFADFLTDSFRVRRDDVDLVYSN